MSGVRRDRAGRPMVVIEFSCRRCQRRLLTSQGEANPPKPGQVPWCGDCLKQGERIELTRRVYRSGPPDLIV